MRTTIIRGLAASLAIITLSSGIAVMSAGTVLAASYTSTEDACRTSLPPLKQGDTGSCVSLLQRQLQAKGYLNEAPDGIFGPDTKAAVASFQGNNGIVRAGYMGTNTWRVLMGTTAKSATASTAKTTATTSTASTNVPSACRSTSGKSICIVKGSGSQATLYAIQGNKVVQKLAARTGDSRPGHATPTGTKFAVNNKYVTYHSKTYDNASMPYSMFFDYNGDAIHYSPDFAKCGYNTKCGAGGASHGCVNIRDLAGIKKLFAWAPSGTPVSVVR